MIVPKDVAEKMRRFEELEKEINDLYSELEGWVRTNTVTDSIWAKKFGVTNEVSGEEVGDDEYLDKTMLTEESGYATHFWPIDESSNYAYYQYLF